MLQTIRRRRHPGRQESPWVDARGRRRSPITRPEYRRGQRPPNYGKKYPPEPLTRDEVGRLLELSGRGPAGTRNRALLVVLYRAGLRISEALALFPKDFDAAAGSITILEGKRRKRRTVGIDPQAAAIVDCWLTERAVLGLNGRHPLFCTITHDAGPDGRPVRAAYCRDLCKRLAKQAGIEKRVHPHGLRHTHAFELANEGHPMHLVQAQLGHDSLSVTGKYLAHIAPTELVKAMRARTWVSDHGDASGAGST
jgi:site-specific recombinase XerD